MLGVYTDLPWAYGAGAGIALSAAHQLRGARPLARAASPTRPVPASPRHASAGDEPRVGRAPRVKGAATGRHLALALVYGALVFVPTSLAVARAHPEWATMQYKGSLSRNDLVLLAAAELALVAAGFLVARGLLVRGRIRLAAVQVIGACLVMACAVVHGPDGDGWRRFVSADRADLARFPDYTDLGDAGPVARHVLAFLGSDVAVALCLAGAPAVGALVLIMGVLHQFGLTDAGAEGPGVIRAGFVGAVVAGASPRPPSC
ncbi:hypothetical protein GEV43_45335 [Actinomadura sp. J1-007]|uniref:hypothetical protein n=1 Tax=Actinomadura sp. J1-007 TaxID=2661913 RepID=UPI0013223DC7|nr:hypothetical protein [Actinomadura sp. J1-007]MWK40467.1 hypothetical protein [Actinomadura sp. J1-007]